MTTFVGAQRGRPVHATSESGNAWADNNKVAITAALTTNDVVVLADVPAGVELTHLRYRAGDLDTGGSPSLAVRIGYRPKQGETAITEVLDAFGSGITALQASTLTAWQERVFEPVRFNEPVEIVLTPTAGAAALGAAADIFVDLRGIVRGII